LLLPVSPDLISAALSSTRSTRPGSLDLYFSTSLH